MGQSSTIIVLIVASAMIVHLLLMNGSKSIKKHSKNLKKIGLDLTPRKQNKSKKERASGVEVSKHKE